MMKVMKENDCSNILSILLQKYSSVTSLFLKSEKIDQ